MLLNQLVFSDMIVLEISDIVLEEDVSEIRALVEGHLGQGFKLIVLNIEHAVHIPRAFTSGVVKIVQQYQQLQLRLAIAGQLGRVHAQLQMMHLVDQVETYLDTATAVAELRKPRKTMQ